MFGNLVKRLAKDPAPVVAPVPLGGPKKYSAKQLHRILADAQAAGKSVTVKTGHFTYRGVTALSKGGARFGGFDLADGSPHAFHVSSVREVIVN